METDYLKAYHIALLLRSFLDPLYLSSSYAPSFPTMNQRELVDHIRSGPVELVLYEPLRIMCMIP
jgi:hypothetical protein